MILVGVCLGVSTLCAVAAIFYFFDGDKGSAMISSYVGASWLMVALGVKR